MSIRLLLRHFSKTDNLLHYLQCIVDKIPAQYIRCCAVSAVCCGITDIDDVPGEVILIAVILFDAFKELFNTDANYLSKEISILEKLTLIVSL